MKEGRTKMKSNDRMKHREDGKAIEWEGRKRGGDIGSEEVEK